MSKKSETKKSTKRKKKKKEKGYLILHSNLRPFLTSKGEKNI